MLKLKKPFYYSPVLFIVNFWLSGFVIVSKSSVCLVKEKIAIPTEFVDNSEKPHEYPGNLKGKEAASP